MNYIRLWIDHPAIGCGSRAFVCYREGRKLAHLVEPTTGSLVTVPKDRLRQATPIERPRWRRIAKQLQTVRRQAKAYGWRVADKTLAAIAADIRSTS